MQNNEQGQFVGEFLPVKTVYNQHQAAGAGTKKYALSKRQFGVIQEFDDVGKAIELARKLDA